jgi:putative transposase
MLNYNVNSLVQWRNDKGEWEDSTGKKLIERVLLINEVATHVVTIDIDPANTVAWPRVRKRTEIDSALEEGKARITTQDPFFRLYRLDKDIEKEHRRRRDSAMTSIRAIVEKHDLKDLLNSKVLGPLITEAAEKEGKDKKKYYIYLRRYWQGGEKENALLPLWHRCGGKGKERVINDDEKTPEDAARGISGGDTAPDSQAEHVKRGRPTNWSKRHNGEPDGINITTSILENIRRSKRLFYEQKGMSFADTYHEFLKTYFASGDEIRNGILTPILRPADEAPQMNQFRYWFWKNGDLERVLTAHYGRRRFQEQMRPLLDTVRGGAYGPGSMFYYDATIADTYLRSPFDRTIIIGRPVIHVIVDLFSAVIVGFAVLMEGPSWLGAMLALENMVRNKVEYCAEHNFFDVSQADWPCQELPRAITSDRGELYSERAREICRTLKIRVAATPPYRPTWKAAVERSFRTLKDQTIKFLPGYVHQRAPGEPDYRYAAQLTVEEFRRVLISGIVRYNRSHEVDTRHFTPDMITARVEPYPSAIWQWGLENRQGSLNELPLDDVRKCLLEDDTATVDRDGLHFNRLRYISPTGERERWYVKAQLRQEADVRKIYFDRRTQEHIYVVLDDGVTIERCTIHPDDARLGNLDWYEAEDHDARQKDAKRDRRTYVRQQRVNDEAYRAHIVAKATQETQAELALTNPSRAAQLRGSGDERERVAADEHKKFAWILGKADDSDPQSHAQSVPNQTVDEITKRRLKLLEDDDE